MVVGDKRNGLRAVFVAFLAVLTVQCVHSYTTTERITSQTQTAMQTTSITDKITTVPITVTPPPDSVCDSNWNCSQTEYCELRNSNVSGSCESCHDSCESCSGPENIDCTSCNISSFIVQHVVYDGEATTPTGTNTTVQTTAVTTTTVEPTTVTTDSRTLTFGPTSTSRSPDVTDNVTSSSTYPNATTMITTMSIETTPEPRNYTIKLECVDQCPRGLKPPWDSSKVCCHVQCKNKGCYGSSISSCCHDNCKTGCYGDGSKKCCPAECHPDYGCHHNGQCRVITSTEGLLPWHWALIGTGGGIVVTGGIIGIICCCIRRRRREPREETDGEEENIGMKKRKSKKRKRNSYVPGPNSVRNAEMNQDGPYANEEYVDHAGLANPAHQQDDAYDDVNVNADVYVEPQPDQFNPGSTDDDIYDQPPPEELNHHQGAANYGYHDDAVYGNDPDQFSGEPYPVSGDQYPVSGDQYLVSGDQYPVSGDQYPVSGDQYPVSGDQYPVSGDQYPVSGDQYPVSGDAGQSGFETAEPVYQNTGFAAQSNVTQEDPSMYQNFEESNSQPGAHEDPNLYYNYTAQHDPVHDLPPPHPLDYDDEQFLSVDSMPSLDPPPPPEDTPSHFQTSQLPLSLPPADLPSLPPPPPPTQTPTSVTRHTASPHGTAGGRKKTRKVPPPPPAGPRPESARRAQRPPRVQVRNRRQQEPAAEIYGYENDQSEVYGYDN